MTTWRYYAQKQLPLVITQLGLPCARRTEHRACPKHHRPIGFTRLCIDCHNEAWAEVGRRYSLRNQGERML